MAPSSPRMSRAAVLVALVAGIIGSCFAVWGMSSQQRITSDLHDVRLPALEAAAQADGAAPVYEQMVWALGLFQGQPIEVADVTERLSPEFLEQVPLAKLISDVTLIAAEGPFEERGYSEDQFGALTVTLEAPMDQALELWVMADPNSPQQIGGLLILFVDEPRGPFSVVEFVVHLIAAWGLLLAGAATWLLRHRVRAGQLLLIAGLLWLAQFLEVSDTSLWYTVGLVAGPLGAAMAALALLSYAAPGLRTGRAKAVAAAVLLAAVANVAPLLAINTSVTGLPDQLLSGSHNRSMAQVLGVVGHSLTIVAAIGLVAVLWLRHHEGSSIGSRLRLALASTATASGLIVVILAGVALVRDHFDLSLSPNVSIAALMVPAGLSIAAVRDRYALGDVATMVAGVDSTQTRSGLQESLARALDDPSVALAFWSEEHGGYVSSDGRPISVEATPERAVTLLASADGPMGALLHDPELLNEPDRVHAASGAARLALDNERLQALVAADLRASRARLLESADAARRQVERDLHDGAQQRLIALQLTLQLERQRAARANEPIDQSFLQAVSDELGGAIEELRQLSRGLRPSALDRGLQAAVDSLAERSPLPIVTNVSPTRAPELIEEAAYFVINESVANATRHSGADHIRVDVDVDAAGETMRLQVADDGAGGARKTGGAGLQSLEDRVLALNGTWILDSPATGGTTLTVGFPLREWAS